MTSPASSAADSLFDDPEDLILDSSPDSVSDSHSASDSEFTDDDDDPQSATRELPPIPGLYVFPALLAPDVANAALAALSDADTFAWGDQVMLFSRGPPHPSSLPAHVRELDDTLRALLVTQLPADVHATAFAQALGRQAILNLYTPGKGITPHVDLPHRYADGIVGVSLTGGCVMTFEWVGAGQEPVQVRQPGPDQEVTHAHNHHLPPSDAPKPPTPSRYDVYLPPRTVYVLSGPARWEWSHGIAARRHDIVVDADTRQTLPRALRVSATFRWMQEGAAFLA